MFRRRLRRSPRVDGAIRRQRRSEPLPARPTGVDREIARLATRQDGIVERRQLRELGLGVAAIDHRVRAGRLIVLYRGVYAVGHEALPQRGTLRAALLAAGPTAILSHRTAAALWRLIPSAPQLVDVTVTRKGPRSRGNLRIHETTRPPETRTIASLRVTAPLRTLTDLARARDIEALCSEALVLNLVTDGQLEAERILDPDRIAPTRSEFERRFRPLIRRAGLPQPVSSFAVGAYEADFAWPDQKLIVETDGWQFHGHRLAFEDDRARDAHLAANGWVVIRVTWRRLLNQPALVMSQLAQTLALRASMPVGGAAAGLYRR